MKRITIVGSGPVGSMQAAILAAILPTYDIYVLDKRESHVRNHGLKIWNNTISHISKQLNEILSQMSNSKSCTTTTKTTKRTTHESSIFKHLPETSVSLSSSMPSFTSQDDTIFDDIQINIKQQSTKRIITENINELSNYLFLNFSGIVSGAFLRTKDISNKLQLIAEKIGKKNNAAVEGGGGSVTFLLGPSYEVKSSDLKSLISSDGQKSEMDSNLVDNPIFPSSESNLNTVQTNSTANENLISMPEDSQSDLITEKFKNNDHNVLKDEIIIHSEDTRDIIQVGTVDLTGGNCKTTIDDIKISIKEQIGNNDLEKVGNHIVTNNKKEKKPLLMDILRGSEIIFGADGSHSMIRGEVFGEPQVSREVIQYLIEIKLMMKQTRDETDCGIKPTVQPKNNKKKSGSYFSKLFLGVTSYAASEDIADSVSETLQSVTEKTNYFRDMLDRSVIPTLSHGKLYVWNESSDGTATLHILVEKAIFDTLRSCKDKNGDDMGTYKSPYTDLEQLPTSDNCVVKNMISKALNETIGSDNYIPGTVKITTIPMEVYKAKRLVKRVDNRLFALVGDAAVGLIFIRGVNNGLQSAAIYAKHLFHYIYGKNQTVPNNGSASIIDEQQNSVPKQFTTCENAIWEMADEKIKSIRQEKRLLDGVKTVVGGVSSMKKKKKKK